MMKALHASNAKLRSQRVRDTSHKHTAAVAGKGGREAGTHRFKINELMAWDS